MISFLALHLWQSTLFLVAAWVLTLAFKRNAAEIRHCIWLVASVKFLVPLELLRWIGDWMGRSMPEPPDVDLALFERASAIFSPSMPGAGLIPDAALLHIQMAAGAIWVLGAAILCFNWWSQWRSIRWTLSFASRAFMGLPEPVCVTSSDLPPGVFGVFRPVVILPCTVLHELESEQLQAVLAHEACHIRRKDNLTATIHKVVEAIFWFHPLVWWLGANLLREREAACDESVIEQGHERRVYAQSILDVCRLGVTRKLSPIATSTGGDLRQRVSSIMSEERVRPIGHGRFALLLAAAMLAWLAPIAIGIVNGAVREASGSGPLTFDTISLTPSPPGWWRSSRFDPDTGELVVKNFSLRHLIASAYPGSRVNGQPEVIDVARYDIEARWHAREGMSERTAYRELLKKVLQRNSNVQLYVNDRCDMQC